MKRIDDYITSIPDFPEKGIIFRDITTVIQDPEGFKLAIDKLIELSKEFDFDLVAGTEARGFLLGAPVAYALGKGFVLVRKKGKLPRKTISKRYALEYGTAEVEMHIDSVKPGQRVLIVDDLIATGGTVKATAELVEELGGTVAGIVFLIELAGLKGREVLNGYEVRSAECYEGK